MEDAGYRPPKVRRQAHDERFEAVRPNHLWHLDFVHRFINRASTFTLEPSRTASSSATLPIVAVNVHPQILPPWSARLR
jgi:hypothetical protein